MDDFFTDSDDDKAVEEILSQAKDMIVLEQVAAINTAGLEHSILPSHIEKRFQKLKSFPSTNQHVSSSSSTALPKVESPKKGSSDPAKESSNPDNKPETLETVNKSPEPRKCQSPPPPSKSATFSTPPPNRKSQKYHWDDDDYLSSRSVSPPAKTGCFLCSPKKNAVSGKKKSGSSSFKENKGGFDVGLADWGKKKNDDDGEFLSDLSNFSSKSQRKLMKKAMKEEEEICKEAEKIVRWAKQASARFDVVNTTTGIDEDDDIDELFSSDDHKF